MSRPMFYPMGTLEIGEIGTMPADTKGAPRRTSKNVSQYGVRHGKLFKCRTVEGVTFITRLG